MGSGGGGGGLAGLVCPRCRSRRLLQAVLRCLSTATACSLHPSVCCPTAPQLPHFYPSRTPRCTTRWARSSSTQTTTPSTSSPPTPTTSRWCALRRAALCLLRRAVLPAQLARCVGMKHMLPCLCSDSHLPLPPCPCPLLVHPPAGRGQVCGEARPQPGLRGLQAGAVRRGAGGLHQQERDVQAAGVCVWVV